MIWPPDDRIRRAFADTARRYDDLARRRYRRVAAEVIEAAGVTRRDFTLDLACGSGLVGRVLTERGLRAPVSVDLSLELLRLAENSPRVAADAQRLPLREESFDVVLCSFGLQMFQDPEAGLREMARVLRPGGRLGLSLWVEGTTARELDWACREQLDATLARQPGYEPGRWQIPQVDVSEPEDLKQALEEAGFSDISNRVRRKRSAYRDASHYFEMLAVYPATWARLNALPAEAREQARSSAIEAIETAVGHAGAFETYEKIVIARAVRNPNGI